MQKFVKHEVSDQWLSIKLWHPLDCMSLDALVFLQVDDPISFRLYISVDFQIIFEISLIYASAC